MTAEALRPSWEARKRRSLELVKAAVLALQERNAAVTVKALHAETQRLDPEGKGVHPTTYRRHPDIDGFLSPILKRRSAVEWHLDLRGITTANLRIGRDLHRALHRLKTKSKRDLALRVLVLEEEVLALRKALAERDVEEVRRLEERLMERGVGE